MVLLEMRKNWKGRIPITTPATLPLTSDGVRIGVCVYVSVCVRAYACSEEEENEADVAREGG